MKLEVPEQPVVPGQEEGDREGEKLPALDEDVLRRVGLAVQEIRRRVALRERRTVWARGRGLGVRVIAGPARPGALRIAGEQRLRRAQQELLQFHGMLAYSRSSHFIPFSLFLLSFLFIGFFGFYFYLFPWLSIFNGNTALLRLKSFEIEGGIMLIMDVLAFDWFKLLREVMQLFFCLESNICCNFILSNLESIRNRCV